MYLRCVKGLKWIPNALTMGNLLGGVVVCWSIVRGPDWGFGGLRAWELTEGGWAEEAMRWDLADLQGEGMIWIAGVWLLAVLFDVFDGLAARKLGVAGPLGVQLDSLADVVTSGVAPAMVGVTLLHSWAPALPEIVQWLPLTMAAAAAYRLARFNVSAEDKEDNRLGFEGMPAPAGALWWWAILLLAAHYSLYGSPGLYGTGGLAYAGVAMLIGSTVIPWMMVSRRRMMDLKSWGKSRAYDRFRLAYFAVAAVLGVLAAIFAEAWPMGVLVALLLYLIWGRFGQTHFHPTTHNATP
jgi:CDP-diacylglycerol--serine O-phosphatidyltransferase